MAWEDMYDLLDDMISYLPKFMDRIEEDSDRIEELAMDADRIHGDFSKRLWQVKDQLDDVFSKIDNLHAEAKTEFEDIW